LLFLAFFITQEVSAQTVGRVVEASGEVSVFDLDTVSWRPLAPGAGLPAGALIRTGANGRVSLLMADETQIQLRANSSLTLQEVAQAAAWSPQRAQLPVAIKTFRSRYQVREGQAWFRKKNPAVVVEVGSRLLTAQLTNTELLVTVIAEELTQVAVLEGVVAARNEYGEAQAQAGTELYARPGEPPRTRLLLSPAESVQWQLRLPETLSAAIAPSLIRSLQRDPAATYATTREQASRRPESALQQRVLAVAALQLDRLPDATAAAERAVTLSPEDAESWIVLGYVRQAAFRLEEADEALKRALQLAPDSVPAMLGQARLHFGAGDSEAARRLTERARSVAPGDPEVIALSGFLRLAQVDGTTAALADFTTALAADPGLGEAWLGLALARMRQGDAPAALEAVTTATLVEPQRALFLSYWGKMLHQVGRHQEALEILEHAQMLDPADPTAPFYRGLILRDLNRPGEAIRANIRAIALNDNRAVYRSRFLLDRDLAVRSVDLALLYRQLGLDAWSRSTALRSVKYDYSNAAAHLFYAGSLLTAPDRALTFESENLLARLLQPANVNTFNTFNDYTALFEQPAVGGTAVVSDGSQGTAVGNFTVFGSAPGAGLAYQFGAFHGESDGFRRNDFEDVDSIAGILKWQHDARGSFLLSASRSETDRGDLVFPRFEIDAPERPDDRQRIRVNRYELGYARELEGGAQWLANLTHADVEVRDFSREVLLADVSPGNDFVEENSSDVERPFDQFTTQLQRRFADHQLMGGLLLNRGDLRADLVQSFGFEPPGDPPRLDLPEERDLDLAYQSFYLQDLWSPTPQLVVEAALYFDHIDNADLRSGAEWSQHSLGPRLGFSYLATERDTFRFAAARYLVPFIQARLDPTDVAGIPLFRNAREGTRVDQVGMRWEHAWTSGFLGSGLFYEDRRFATEASGQLEQIPSRLKGLELELNQILTPSLGLAASYRYQDVGDQQFPQLERDEHLLIAGLRYVLPGGFSAGLLQTYRHINFATDRENEDIHITDLDLAYELPAKRGELRLQVLNLFDHEFNWVTDRFELTGRVPARQFLGTVSLNF
jgi:tetratricopeptide (TPR) repeat protein